jgi:hypothetical protein
MMNKYFFLDNAHIELDEHIERVFHEPVKHGRPVLAPATDIEGEVCVWNAPLPTEDGRWRLWYIGQDGDNSLPLYAESEDGINWHRPNLHLVEYAGSRKNNIVDTGRHPSGRYEEMVLAPNPSWDGVSAARYCGLMYKGGAQPIGLFPLQSHDGFRWQPVGDPNHPVILSSDEYRLWCDSEHGLLIATVKLYGHSMDVSGAVPEYGRQVGLSTSTDGVVWTSPEFIYHADAADRQAGAEALQRYAGDPDYRSPLYCNPEHFWMDVYNMPVFPYHGMYIGLPAMFQHSGYWIADESSANQDGLIWPALTWSNDLTHWERPGQRKPFIALSPSTDREIYDNGMLFACPPIQRGDELWFYYTGYRHSHVMPSLLKDTGLDYAQERVSSALFLARLRLDGFASLRASERKGAVLTRPIVVDGPTLHINARTKNGEILAEIRDADSGRVIPGFGIGDYLASPNLRFPEEGERTRLAGPGTRRVDEQVDNDAVPFSGDQVDAVLAWRGGEDLSALQGRAVRILFALRNADLYSFWFSRML